MLFHPVNKIPDANGFTRHRVALNYGGLPIVSMASTV